MKRSLTFASVALAFIVVGFVVLWLVNPFALAVLYGSVFGFGHPRNPPHFAESLRFQNDSVPEISEKWTALLRERFPLGSSGESISSTLRQQKFAVEVEQGKAQYQWGGMPCLYTLSVEWKNDNESVTSIEGAYYFGCL